MRFAKVIGILLVATILIWSCNKDSLSPIPYIQFIEQSRFIVPDSGVSQDLISFKFNFEDGDADTGPIEGKNTNFPNQNIIFIDSRDSNNIRAYDFPPIPSNVVTRDGITGTFTVYMLASDIYARTDTTVHKTTDTVSYEVYVYDAEYNISNRVKTDSIVIVK